MNLDGFMHSTHLKKFDATYVLTVGNVCTRVISSLNKNTKLDALYPFLTNWEHTWVLIHHEPDHHIIGAVRTDTLKAILEKSLEPQTLEDVVETKVTFIVETTPLNQLYLKDGVQVDWWYENPISIVTNSVGTPIGYLDNGALSRTHMRHMLNKTAQNSVMQNHWISTVASIASELEIPVYLIGGWVRDFILETPSPDLDFAVEGNVVGLVSTLVEHFGGTCHEFTNFGGVHWVISETFTLDFTQCRKEQYTSFAALPIVSKTHIDGDLTRRDFNINAMALALTGAQFGLFIDPFMGLQSLESKEIHTLHSMSFLEDPTRIFRASRYCARFNMRLSDTTTEQLQHALATIQLKTMLTLQRVGIELEKIFQEYAPNDAWKRLQQWNVWTHWLPHWDSIDLHHNTSLSIHPTQEEWATCWWMQLCVAIPIEEQSQWKSIVGIRQHGLKLWTNTPVHLAKMVALLSDIEKSNPEKYAKIGLALNGTTTGQWLLLETLYPKFLPLLRWWVDTGRHRNRVTTGKYLLTLKVAKGPMMAELLRVAQNIAWSGGDEEAEKTAIQSHIQKKTSSS